MGVDVCSNTITQAALNTQNGKKRCVPIPTLNTFNVNFGQYDQEELALLRQRLDEHFREAALTLTWQRRSPFFRVTLATVLNSRKKGNSCSGGEGGWTVVLSQKKRRKGQKKQVIASSNKTVPVSFRVCSLSPGKKIPILQGVLCSPGSRDTCLNRTS